MKLLAFAVVAALAAPAAAAKYQIDPMHSSVTFTVRHLVTKVHGTFRTVSGTFDYDDAKSKGSAVDVKIDPASVDTNVEKRDAHLKSDAFFDVAKCPEMSFKSTKAFIKNGKGSMTGDLTMHCVTKPVTLALEIGGVTKDPKMGERFGASATGKLNRQDWGVSYGKGMVGDDVNIEIDVEATPAQ